MKINEDLLTYGYLNCKNLGRWNANTNLDDLKPGETCFWNTSDYPTNVPFKGGRCYCFYGYSTLKYQMAVYFNSDLIAIRHTWNGVWSSWGFLDDVSNYLKRIGRVSFSTITKGSYTDVNISSIIPSTGAGKLYLISAYSINHGSFYASAVFYIHNGSIQGNCPLYSNTNCNVARASSYSVRINNTNSSVDMPAGYLEVVCLTP